MRVRSGKVGEGVVEGRMEEDPASGPGIAEEGVSRTRLGSKPLQERSQALRCVSVGSRWRWSTACDLYISLPPNAGVSLLTFRVQLALGTHAVVSRWCMRPTHNPIPRFSQFAQGNCRSHLPCQPVYGPLRIDPLPLHPPALLTAQYRLLPASPRPLRTGWSILLSGRGG